MPSFGLYQRLLGSPVHNNVVRKNAADEIMEETWWEDIASRVAYLYDYYHDDEPLKLRGLRSDKSRTKTPIDIKYIVDTYQSLSKDQVPYHLQLRPSQTENVPYYGEQFREKYGALFPIGLYIDIPDEKGEFNKWLVVDKANFYNPQFVTFQILPCDYIFQYILDNKKHQIAGVLRSQNS